MDIFEVNSVVIKSLLEIAGNTPVLQPIELDVNRIPIRLKERNLVVTDSIDRNRAVVTAHNLSDYKTNNYSLVIRTKPDTWLARLLDIQNERLRGE